MGASRREWRGGGHSTRSRCLLSGPGRGGRVRAHQWREGEVARAIAAGTREPAHGPRVVDGAQRAGDGLATRRGPVAGLWGARGVSGRGGASTGGGVWL